MGKMSCKLTIFEGPDGGGKSTAAQAFAKKTGARYVHFGAFPHIDKDLGRMYAEGMLPAVLGYQDVVFDRSWPSEMPYGAAFREGKDRLASAGRRILERLAMRCGAVVIRCQPSWETVKANYLDRKHVEMLDDEHQLKMVYDLYARLATDLPVLDYDYTKDDLFEDDRLLLIEKLRMHQHPVNLVSAGNWDARIVMVGKSIAEHKDTDILYQWPFGSFSSDNCSQWLADQLDLANVGEDQILWLDSGQDLAVLYELNPERIIAIDAEAYQQLYNLDIDAVFVQHPEVWKRHHSEQRYPLLDFI